ncbi:MAG: hypothetical protein ACRYGI_09400 [Janthinobacterium lividum]
MPIPLRGDFTAARMQAAATKPKDGLQAPHLLDAGHDLRGMRINAAKVGGVTLQIVPD